ncbi:hypothetical protein ABLI39_03935 [Pseudarthrobacter sp. B907]|uniref:hypothetical protein n=1 Tax=Pseudarthrobacter sp. B907 TaxID=3158261 RepID=UPI0032DB7DF6
MGTMLRQTRKLIRSMDLPGTPAVELLKSQAVEGARALDAALAAGRPLSAALRMHGEAVKALKASEVPPPPPEPEDPVGPVADADDMDLWLAAIHGPSVTCQPGFPAVRPGRCDRCDAAPMARAMYGRRHPERPGHEFGMSREECACARCAAELAIVRESMGKI